MGQSNSTSPRPRHEPRTPGRPRPIQGPERRGTEEDPERELYRSRSSLSLAGVVDRIRSFFSPVSARRIARRERDRQDNSRQSKEVEDDDVDASSFEMVDAEAVDVTQAAQRASAEEQEPGLPGRVERSLSADLAQQLEKKATMGSSSDFSPTEDPYLQFPFFVDKNCWRWVSSHRTMFVLRGLSGSGKSTIVKTVLQYYPGAVVCSADDFFVREDDGVYDFDAALLKDAHAYCQKRAADACKEALGPVVIDNTNIKKWEMNSYFSLASKHGYHVFLLESKTPWRRDPKELARRNTHSVPEEVIARKVGEFRPIPALYFAWFSDEEGSRSLLALGRRWLRRGLDSCQRLREEFADFSGFSDVNDMARHYFTRDACLPANRRVVHCTAKFCGGGGGEEYAEREDVIDSLGKIFDIRIIGFVVTPRTLGARVLLDGNELSLWGQDDEESLGVVQKPPNRLKGKKGKKGKKSSSKPSFKTREDFLKSGGGSEEEEEAFCDRLQEYEDEVGDRFYPVPGRGRRAHVTLGTSGEDVKPVTTGLDLLEAVRAERAAAEGREQPQTFSLEGGSELRRYKEGLWVVYLEKAVVFDSVFAGHYT